MNLSIPMKLPSTSNLREHWAKRAARIKTQRNAVAMAIRSMPCLKRHRLEAAMGSPLDVRLVRVATRHLDDDNLAAAFKGVRDQIALELGTTDGPNGPIRWMYSQQRPVRATPPRIMIFIGVCGEDFR